MDGTTFVSIDTETTGLSFTDDVIIQFGYSVVRDSEIINCDEWFINTDVPNAGEHVNHITREQIDSGTDVLTSLLKIKQLLSLTKVICIYNAPFDLMMLANEFRRYGIEYDFSPYYVIDPLLIERHYKPIHPKPFYRLQPTAARYGVRWAGEAHSAGADSAASASVWLTQRSWLGIRKHALDLHRAETKWYQEWAFGFEIYGLEHNRDDIVIVNWPLEKEMICSPQSKRSSLLW